MGKISSGLAGALFPAIKARILTLLIGQPNKAFHASEIIRRVASGSGAVQRELEKLARSHILTVTADGNRKVYQANSQSPIFAELHGIIVKTCGLLEPLREALQPFESQIDCAFVYGSIAKGTDTAKSDIDLMIIADAFSYFDVFGALQKAEKVLSRTINPTVLTKTEWKERVNGDSAFLRRVMERPKLFVIGTEDELG